MSGYLYPDEDDSCRECGHVHGGHGNCPNYCSQHDHLYTDEDCPVCWAEELVEDITDERLEALQDELGVKIK